MMYNNLNGSFTKRSFDVTDFEYHGTVPKFHTAKEMAGFMLDLPLDTAQRLARTQTDRAPINGALSVIF